MAKKKSKLDSVLNTIGKMGGSIVSASSAVDTVVPAAEHMTSEIIGYLNKKHEDEKDMLDVPDICTKDIALTLEQAEELLTASGLKIMAVKTPMSEAGEKYKDCFDTQVVAYHKDGKGKVAPGSVVRVKYITQDVIDESKRLYEEQELKKEHKRAENKEKRDKLIGRLPLIGKKEE